MGIEIERKFLTASDAWRAGAQGRRYRQGYLAADPGCTVRVRVVDDEAWLTIKGPTQGLSRSEFEYPIPVADAVDLLASLCQQPVIDKTRYRIVHGHHVWEIDEFHGANAGLVIAEIELASESEAFARPAWLGAEVSADPRYFNSNLARSPYRDWSATD